MHVPNPSRLRRTLLAWLTACIPLALCETGKTEFRRLGGAGVPIILVGDRRMNGFSAEQLNAMLKNQTQ
jgi:hypothetical protein